jgi:hypothetical protein
MEQSDRPEELLDVFEAAKREQERLLAMNKIVSDVTRLIDSVVDPYIAQRVGDELHPNLVIGMIGKACLLAASAFLCISCGINEAGSEKFAEKMLFDFRAMSAANREEQERVARQQAEKN